MENRLTEHIGSPKRRICLCVKILIVTVALFVLLQAAAVISLYINVNSGGLEPISGDIFLYCSFSSIVFLLLSLILIPICFIVSLAKIDAPVNILLTIVAIAIAMASFEGVFYPRNIKIKRGPEPDVTRCVANNMARGKYLNKLGFNLKQLKNDKDFIFTEQFLETNLVRDIPHLKNGIFAFNSNVLSKKPSQLPGNIVVIFESNIPRDKDYIGGPNDISTWWHYGRGSLMVFCDGRVEFVKTEDFNNLRWKP